MDRPEKIEKSQIERETFNNDSITANERLEKILLPGKEGNIYDIDDKSEKKTDALFVNKNEGGSQLETRVVDSENENFNPYLKDGREVPDSMKPYMDKKGKFDYYNWQQDLQERQLADAKKHGVPSDNMVEEYEKSQTDRTTINKGQTADERLDKILKSGKESVNFNINDNGEKKGDALSEVVDNQNTKKEFTESDLDELKNDKSWIVGNAGKYIENNNVNVFVDNTESFQDPNNIAEAREWIDEKGNLHKDIAFNDAWIDKLSPNQIKADITHEVGHLKGGDEVQAWLDEAQTGYSDEKAKKICFRSDEQQKTYNEIKHDLISRCHYEEKDFDYR